MKVTHVSLQATQAAMEAGRPALTPELMAATGARYSRNNEGLEQILSQVDFDNPDKSVDSIFRMVDYGHASIGDMVPVAMFMDDISIWMAYYLWSICPTASGQESSTRYIKMSADGVDSAERLHLSCDDKTWSEHIENCFIAYHKAVEIWNKVGEEQPSLTGIPQSLINEARMGEASDASHKAQLKIDRMKRNFAFDRARYFLPVAAKTNQMMIMSARSWVTLCQHLLSHPLREANMLGGAIREELNLVAPRLTKHARRSTSYVRGLWDEFVVEYQIATNGHYDLEFPYREVKATPYLDVYRATRREQLDFDDALRQHDNRYAFTGSSIQRTSVRFAWEGVAFAEIRDLNRHRTGTKYCPAVPGGFYCALDQACARDAGKLESLAIQYGGPANEIAIKQLANVQPTYVYWMTLGSQFYFEHTTTADKFIYEAELRTGTGAHFRYAKHLRDMLELWYEKYPMTKGLIQEGKAEPE